MSRKRYDVVAVARALSFWRLTLVGCAAALLMQPSPVFARPEPTVVEHQKEIPTEEWAYLSFLDEIDSSSMRGGIVMTADSHIISLVCADNYYFVTLASLNPAGKMNFILAGMRSDHAEVAFKADDGRPVIESWELGGRPGQAPYLTAPASSVLGKLIAEAKDKIVLRALGTTFHVPLKGATEIVSYVQEACGKAS